MTVVAGPVSAQGVLLRINPPEGQVTHHRMVVETYMKGGPMAQMAADTTLPFMRMRGWQTTTVTAVSGEEHTFTQVVDSMRVESPGMPQMAAMIGQMGDMMKGLKTVTRMTSRGKVTALEVTLPPAAQALAGAQGGTMGMGGGSGPSMSSFVLLPERPVRVGGTWRDSMTVALDSAGVSGGTAKFVAMFTLKAMEGRVAVIGLDGTLTVSGAAMPAGMSLTVTGEEKLDLDAGRVTAVTTEMSGTAPTAMGDVPMRVTVTMTQS